MKFSYVNTNEIHCTIDLTIHELNILQSVLDAVENQDTEWREENELDHVCFTTQRLLSEVKEIGKQMRSLVKIHMEADLISEPDDV